MESESASSGPATNGAAPAEEDFDEFTEGVDDDDFGAFDEGMEEDGDNVAKISDTTLSPDFKEDSQLVSERREQATHADKGF